MPEGNIDPLLALNVTVSVFASPNVVLPLTLKAPSTVNEVKFPTDVILLLPVQVLNPEISPVLILKDDFNVAVLTPATPLAVNWAYSPTPTEESSTLTALVLAIPNVKASWLAFHVAAESI